ncbi:DUF1211 domain-containing protein [Actinoplanes sp. TBRC 11911]|uniref:TMEM175 family protein n=1 Tax=Actinoplanes sp. TBRC 11911 TaxID=2729386 RepID=UPI00145C893B|nr:TMEM175 family protein [Actinoplanes sp. TBRC 11911]NMO54762.1 DUF1211 domain-containing protein [Actinoplanes sp. TBRC 11911]
MTEPGEKPAKAERLVMFTDAVAAIALTLLILPLLETIADARAEHPQLGDLIGDNLGQFGAFALSFAVIFRFWWAHHRLFEHIETLNPVFVRLSTIWTFAIVVLPIPTAIITAYSASPGSVALYGGTLALCSGALTAMAWYAHRHPEYSGNRPRESREMVLGNVTIFFAQVVATAVGSVFADQIGFFAFLLMFLVGPVEGIVKARWRRESAL